MATETLDPVPHDQPSPDTNAEGMIRDPVTAGEGPDGRQLTEEEALRRDEIVLAFAALSRKGRVHPDRRMDASRYWI